jgi:hypothetical protein
MSESRMPTSAHEQSQVQKAHQSRLAAGATFIERGWKVLVAILLLTLFLTIGGQVSHAAARTQTSAQTTHPHVANSCNLKTYPVQPTATLQRDTGEVVYLQADNLNHFYAVDISQDGTYEGIYYLSIYWDAYEIHVYAYGGAEWVDACTNWTYLGA